MNRSFRHWTPRYLADRLRLLWHERTHPDDPWLTREATLFLDGWLDESHAGVEWGTGRSTIWLARRVRRLLAIEHDAAWHARVKERLSQQGLTNVNLRLIPVEGPDTANREHPYVAETEALPARSLDFALVDGVLRDYCAERALDLVRPGGILVIDNANWFLPVATRSPASCGASGNPPTESWARVWRRLMPLQRRWTSNGITDTAVFFLES